MEARLKGAALVVGAILSLGAGYRTPNFVVQAPTAQMAEEIGKAAEKCRHDLAIEWTGKTMPNWSQPCPLTAEVADNLGAGGATSFVFDRGEVFGWQMNIQGPYDRVLDSVLPHEVTHTIFASHFRCPLPRWADEGGCSTVEHTSERMKQQKMLIQFLQTGRGISFSQMFAMREYPRDILPLYAQGHSLASYLVAQGGKRKYINFLADGLRNDQWVAAVERHYGYPNLGNLQNSWLEWVRKGSPALENANQQPTQIAANDGGDVIFRGQSPEPEPAGRLVAVGQPPAAAPSAPENNGWRVPTSAQPVSHTSVESNPGLAPAPNAAPPSAGEPGEVLIQWDQSVPPQPPTTAGVAPPSAPATATAARPSIYDARVPPRESVWR